VPELEDFARSVEQRFELLATSPEAGERDHWQDAFELPARRRHHADLLVRGATLPRDARLMVFDDITEVVSAQRSAAWAEVARRLAHEIKNPLTPIQLSAERLQHKLEAKLEGADQSLLLRSVATIVAQVQAMQTAGQRVPRLRAAAGGAAAAAGPERAGAEVLALYGQRPGQRAAAARLAARPAAHPGRRHAAAAGHPQPGAERAGRGGRPARRPGRAAHRSPRRNGELRAVRLTVIDNGPGFADKVLKRAFEPYVTTKAKGTGLGLAVVKKIADEHGARLRAANLHAGDEPDGPVTGPEFRYHFPTFRHRPPPRHRRLPPGGHRQRNAAGALSPHGNHPGSRRRAGHPRPAVGDPHRRGPHGRAGRERRPGAPGARALRPDLVLLDIWMPDVDGITLLKEWGASGQLTMPVIMMSGHGTIDTAVEATKYGASAFLEKPITLQKLLRAVEQALAKPGQRRPPPPPARSDRGDQPRWAPSCQRPRPRPQPAAPLPNGPQAEQSFDLDRPLREARDAFEKSYFEFHLAKEGGSMTRVAEKTGLERTHLYRKLKQLGVDLSRNKRGGGLSRAPPAPSGYNLRLDWPGSSVGRAAD
jgi:CheY-like chemotaxis protein